MTEKEILKLSDDELRVKAAELDGWTDFRAAPHVLDDDIWGIPPPGKQTLASVWNLSTPASEPVPEPLSDYLNDIAAAWELWEKGTAIGKRFWMALLEFCDDGDQSTVYERVLREITPKNITRAFVLAMTQTGLRISNDNVEFIRDGKVIVDKHGVHDSGGER